MAYVIMPEGIPISIYSYGLYNYARRYTISSASRCRRCQLGGGAALGTSARTAPSHRARVVARSSGAPTVLVHTAWTAGPRAPGVWRSMGRVQSLGVSIEPHSTGLTAVRCRHGRLDIDVDPALEASTNILKATCDPFCLWPAVLISRIALVWPALLPYVEDLRKRGYDPTRSTVFFLCRSADCSRL